MQLALAGVVLVVAVGGGIAAVQVQAQRERDRIAADEQTRQKERQTRAAALVDSLGSAETPVVTRIRTDLADLRELARPKLVELASLPITTKPGLHARLALLADEPQPAAELAAYVPTSKPEELLTLRDVLKPHAAEVAPGLWAVLTDAKVGAGRRVRAAGALASLTPGDGRWAAVADVVAKTTPGEFVVWSQALEPVRAALLPALLKRYPETRAMIDGASWRWPSWRRRRRLPVVAMTWYEAAAYCNWHSAREGVPADQWCYETNKAGKYDEEMRMKAGHLKLKGYRLPTEAEWEYACRGGTETARTYGRGEELPPRYGWIVKTSELRAWPVERLRPNERGLFDKLGNAFEWCEDPALPYMTGRKSDVENGTYAIIDERMGRPLRGGSFIVQPDGVRCASCGNNRPGPADGLGFRPTRTLPDAGGK